MIVASIRKGFQQHSLRGLGCGNCGGSCRGAMKGLGWTGTCLNPVIQMDSVNIRNAADTAAYVAACYGTASSLTNANATVDANGIVVTPVVSSPVSMVAPTATPVSQVVQQSGGATGVVTTPIVSTSIVGAVDNPLMDLLDSTIFGIPLWLLGAGGIALMFMGGKGNE